MTQPNIKNEPFTEHLSIDATTDLDYSIFSGESLDLPLNEQISMQETFVRAAFEKHLNGCSEYARYVEQLNFDYSNYKLSDIPVIPVSTFKEKTLLSVNPGEVEKWSLSSGTRGTQSRVGRDQKSLERLLGSIQTGMEMLGSWHEDEVNVVHLGPDREEAGDIWFLYVMSLIELIQPTDHLVRNGTFKSQHAIDTILDLMESSDSDIIVVGAPFMVVELMNLIERNNIIINGNNRLMVVTAGGWKRHKGLEVTRDSFNEKVCQKFGLNSTEQVRDIFNQVELNTAFVECSAHRMHVPPWVYATTRDPDNLEVQEPGKLGLLSYLDASASSYPAFIVTDDVGHVQHGACPCGREGVTMKVVRRLKRAVSRGCSIAIDEKTNVIDLVSEVEDDRNVI